MKTVLSLIILAGGVGVAWIYLRPQRQEFHPSTGPLSGDRPWRRVGAGICLVLSIMFVAGIHWLDVLPSPTAFVVYWMTILGLVMWLCALAVKDMLHTRRAIRQWRRRRANRRDAEEQVQERNLQGEPDEQDEVGP